MILIKDDKKCTCDKDQFEAMKKAGWKKADSAAVAKVDSSDTKNDTLTVADEQKLKEAKIANAKKLQRAKQAETQDAINAAKKK